MSEPVLSIRNLKTEFVTPEGVVSAVDDVSLDLYPGEILGVVGESGSGKSVMMLSVLGLVPDPPGRIVGGSVHFDGRDLLRASASELRAIRGNEIAMIFQDPMTSLNPLFTIGDQISEAIIAHDPGRDRRAALNRSIELLELVGVPNAHDRMDQYPHEFSGGMRQRAMIAMAIANEPKVLIADEPTTALDVTIQAQVLEVLSEVQQRTGAATILITHDVGLIAEVADRVAVMYGGKLVELADVNDIFHNPKHPYTVGLMESLPHLETDVARLVPIVGNPPSLIELPSGCSFHPRCSLYQGRPRCTQDIPPLYEVGERHRSACHFYEEVKPPRQEVGPSTGSVDGPGVAT